MNKKHGFTLIELLAVVVILGILTSIALPQYRKSIQRAEAANALINLKTIFDSAKRYKATHSAWPTSVSQLDVDLYNISSEGNMGEFQYTFEPGFGGNVSACRLKGNDSDSAYCLQAYYQKNNTRDVYQCLYLSEKYKPLCQSLGTCPAGNIECLIE